MLNGKVFQAYIFALTKLGQPNPLNSDLSVQFHLIPSRLPLRLARFCQRSATAGLGMFIVIASLVQVAGLRSEAGEILVGSEAALRKALASLDTTDGQPDRIRFSWDSLTLEKPLFIPGTDALSLEGPVEITGAVAGALLEIELSGTRQVKLEQIHFKPKWGAAAPPEAIRVTCDDLLGTAGVSIKHCQVKGGFERVLTIQQETLSPQSQIQVELQDCHIVGCNQDAVHINLRSLCDIRVEACHVDRSGGHALALMVDQMFNLQIIESEFLRSDSGVQLLSRPQSKRTTIRIRDSLFAGNRAFGFFGQDLIQAKALITGCTFHDNAKRAMTPWVNGCHVSLRQSRGQNPGRDPSTQTSTESQFEFSDCIFSGKGSAFYTVGTNDEVAFSDCNFVLEAGPTLVSHPDAIPYGQGDPSQPANPQGPQTTYSRSNCSVEDPIYGEHFSVHNQALATLMNGEPIRGFGAFIGGVQATKNLPSENELKGIHLRAQNNVQTDPSGVNLTDGGAATEVRRSLETGDLIPLQHAAIRFQGLLEGCRRQQELHPGAPVTIRKEDARDFYHSYFELNETGLLSAQDSALVRGISEDMYREFSVSDWGRIPNTQNMLHAAGFAMAAKCFPNLTHASSMRLLALSIWKDWIGDGTTNTHGDSFEVAPSGSFIISCMTLANALDEDAAFDRYTPIYLGRLLPRWHPNGIHAGQPRSTMAMNALWSDPWGETDANHIDTWANAWAELAVRLKDPRMMHTAQQLFIDGAPKDRLPPVAKTGLKARFGHMALLPKPLAGGAEVSIISPTSLRIPERVLLTPSRGIQTKAPKNSFASFLIHDRMPTIKNRDDRGSLKTFVVDGQSFFTPSAPSNRLLIEVDPAQASSSVINWSTRSQSLSSLAMKSPSKHWKPKKAGQEFQWIDTRNRLGIASENPTGRMGLNNKIDLRSITIHLSRPAGIEADSQQAIACVLRELRLEGANGKRIVAPFGPEQVYELAIRRIGESQVEPIAYSKSKTWMKATEGTEASDQGGMQLSFPPDAAELLLTVYHDLSFDQRSEYSLVTLDIKAAESDEALAGSIQPSIRFEINRGTYNGSSPRLALDDTPGLILDSVEVASNSYGDVHTSFSYSGLWPTGTTWTRQAILTQEGMLAVRDDVVFTKGRQDALRIAVDWPAQNRISASSYVIRGQAAWWQNKATELLLYVPENQFGTLDPVREQLRFVQPFKSRDKTSSTDSSPAEQHHFFYLFVPREAGMQRAAPVSLESSEGGNQAARIETASGPITIELHADTWSVHRTN